MLAGVRLVRGAHGDPAIGGLERLIGRVQRMRGSHRPGGDAGRERDRGLPIGVRYAGLEEGGVDALAFARNPEAYRHLSLQFEHREINKIYHAVVDGIHDFQDTLVEIPILKLDDGTVTLSRQGKDATTHFTTLEAFRAHTLVECRPVTGRMHQIRIHLRHLKAPITGDLIYGGRPFLLSEVKRKFNLKKGAEEQPLMRRMALHAFRLEFADLAGNQRVVEAPYPKDFRALVRQLGVNRLDSNSLLRLAYSRNCTYFCVPFLKGSLIY